MPFLGATFSPWQSIFSNHSVQLNYNFDKRKQYTKILTKAGDKEDENYLLFVLSNSLLGEHLFILLTMATFLKSLPKLELPPLIFREVISQKQVMRVGRSGGWGGAVGEGDGSAQGLSTPSNFWDIPSKL